MADYSIEVSVPNQGPQGEVGPVGPANTLTIGTVSGGATAAATITGTAPSQTLNLVLPQGEVGPQGPQGPAGEQTTDASLLTSGTLNDARLSANVALENAANTFSQNQTLNGTNNVAPNQTAASGSSLMTRDLVDLRMTNFRVDRVRPISTVPSTWTATAVGSGGRGTGTDSVDIFSGATASSSMVVHNRPNGILTLANIGSNTPTGITWTSATQIDFLLRLASTSTNSVFRILFGANPSLNTVSDLDRRGVGVRISNTGLAITQHNNTALTTSANLVSLVVDTVYWFSLRRAAASATTELYLNGSFIGSETGGPTTNGGSADGINLSVTNGGDASNARMIVQYITLTYL